MNDVNYQNYTEEVERNSKIFEEKMNKLNSDYEDDNSHFNKKMISYNTYNYNFKTLNSDNQ